MKDSAWSSFALPETIAKDKKVQLRLKGSVTADTQGFRVYLIQAPDVDLGPSNATEETIYTGMKKDGGADFKAGESFDVTTEIYLDSGDAKAVNVKGPSYGTNVSGVTIEGIWYKPAAEK